MTDIETVSVTVARNLAAFARQERAAEAVERARSVIADTLGVTIAGAGHNAIDILADTVFAGAAQGASTLIGRSERAGLLDAALINGAAGHMLDFDDSNSDLFGHLSVAILPALLALAEHKRANGDQLLAAFLAGYEAGCRFGNAFSRFQYTHGWHPTTTVGIFAATSACCVLLALDERRTAMALGIAAHLASGIKSNFGSMTKPLGAGHANRNALMAVLLAERGFTSAERAFEHHHGYLNVFNQGPDNVDLEALTASWQGQEKILDPAKGIKQKRFPCCFAIAPVLDCALELRRSHNLRAHHIAGIALKVHPIRFPHINVPVPATSLAAKFSTSYCVARAILTGQVTIEDFESDAELSAPATRALMQKTTLEAYDRKEMSGADVTITTTDGQVLSHSVDAARGATYQNPLTPDMVWEKFRDAVSRRLGDEAAVALWKRLELLSDCADIGELTALMRPPEVAEKNKG